MVIPCSIGSAGGSDGRRRRRLRCMPAVNSSMRTAGGQCPLKRGAIDHHHCRGELVNQLTSVLTN